MMVNILELQDMHKRPFTALKPMNCGSEISKTVQLTAL